MTTETEGGDAATGEVAPNARLRIFINYRRDETRFHASQLYAALAPRFGKDYVFIDVDAIEPGLPFDEVLDSAVAECDVLIAMIGPRWLQKTKGKRRLDDPDDWVRLELEAALRRKIRVIPAILLGAEVPKSDQLPESLRALTLRQGVRLRDDRDWSEDVNRLIGHLDRMQRKKVERLGRAGERSAVKKKKSASRKPVPASKPAAKSRPVRAPAKKPAPKPSRLAKEERGRTLAEAAVLRHLAETGVFAAREKAVATCPYTDAFISRELNGKSRVQIDRGHVVVTNMRILLVSNKKLVAEFPWTTFAWSGLEPLDGVSRASVQLGRRKDDADLTLWVFNFMRGEALARAVAARVATATRSKTTKRAAKSSPSKKRRSAKSDGTARTRGAVTATREIPSALRDSLLDGRYRLVRKLGSGAMANVYLAEDEALGREVAIKVLDDRHAGDRQFVERFGREVGDAAVLSHPNIVTIYDRGAADGTYYVVTEYVAGRSLRELIASRGPAPVSVAIDYARQILAALRFAHGNRLVHRAVRPQNVLVDAEGHVKVKDFGIGLAGVGQLRDEDVAADIAHYVSPEQVQGAPVDQRSDLYSLGVVLSDLLTGRVPFRGDTAVETAMKHLSATPPSLREQRPEIPQSLEQVVLRALAQDPTQRYQSADQMDADLERVAKGLAVSRETEETAMRVLQAKKQSPFAPVLGPRQLVRRVRRDNAP